MVEQRGFADTRRAGYEKHGGVAESHLLDGVMQAGEFIFAPDRPGRRRDVLGKIAFAQGDGRCIAVRNRLANKLQIVDQAFGALVARIGLFLKQAHDDVG